MPQFCDIKQTKSIGAETGPYEVVDVDYEFVALVLHFILLIRTIFLRFVCFAK